MKRRRIKAKSNPVELSTTFLRGAVAAGLISGLQDRSVQSGRSVDGRRVVRHALQGGLALLAGTVASEAAMRRQYGTAAFAVLAGAALIAGAETVLQTASAEALPMDAEQTHKNGDTAE